MCGLILFKSQLTPLIHCSLPEERSRPFADYQWTTFLFSTRTKVLHLFLQSTLLKFKNLKNAFQRLKLDSTHPKWHGPNGPFLHLDHKESTEKVFEKEKIRLPSKVVDDGPADGLQSLFRGGRRPIPIQQTVNTPQSALARLDKGKTEKTRKLQNYLSFIRSDIICMIMWKLGTGWFSRRPWKSGPVTFPERYQDAWGCFFFRGSRPWTYHREPSLLECPLLTGLSLFFLIFFCSVCTFSLSFLHISCVKERAIKDRNVTKMVTLTTHNTMVRSRGPTYLRRNGVVLVNDNFI